MGKHNRSGSLTPRNKRIKPRKMKMGYYTIITDTKATERIYFEGLKKALPIKSRSDIVIRVVQTKTKKLIDLAMKELNDPQYRIPWIVFDRDLVVDFDHIIMEAEKRKIHVGWSNPCIEIWFQTYFGEMKNTEQSTKCNQEFRKKFKDITGMEYKKSNPDLYRFLIKYGNEDKAILRAKNRYKNNIRINDKPSEMTGCTTVYQLVEEIKMKTEY